MDMINIIQKKKRNLVLSKKEIEYVVNEYVNGKIPDYQMSALLMAIYFNGMNYQETTDLTLAMVNSGDVMNLSSINGVTVDKHSTGGVGDKTTLIVAPIVAALGGHVAKMSGKGLGHTGGTIDKLESIEGFKTTLSEDEFFKQVNNIGVAVIGQTGNLTPADKKMYALRDVTGTVDSIPLIASSVMSKKIAAGSDCIVLDVKVGSGAFMKDLESATELAETMIQIGNGAGRKVIVLITNMDVPLGRNIGNSLEVKEAIEILKGEGPKDLRDVSIELATYMHALCKKFCNKGKEKFECDIEADEIAVARKEVIECIASGKALDKLKEMVKMQGGNEEFVSNVDLFPKALCVEKMLATEAGYIVKMDTEKIGLVSSELGAGRKTKDDVIDYTAGIVLNKTVGDYVEVGECIAELHSSKISGVEFDEIKEKFRDALEIVQSVGDGLFQANVMSANKVLKVLK